MFQSKFTTDWLSAVVYWAPEAMDEDEARLKGALWKIGDLDFSEKPCVSEQTCPWWIDVEGFPVPQVVYAEPADDGQAVTPESRQVPFIAALTWLAR